MQINRKIVITAAMALALGVSSCRKFLNINKNPNISPTATVQTLLPAAQLYVASTLGVDLEINGSFWAQYWTQSPSASQYKILDQYNPNQDNYAYPWVNLYKAGENFYQLGILADTLKDKQYKAIALIMKGYTFQLITDGWGDAPYTQALKGQVADSNIVNPKYDSQRVIYNGILADIDSGMALINNADAVKPGADDLIYGGDMNKWKKFAYTLKLRIYLRMSAIDPVGAKAAVQAMYAASDFALIAPGDDALINFGYSSSTKSPLYAEASSATLAGAQNLVGSSTCIDSMNNNGDPRAYVFYEPLASALEPLGIAQGDYNSNPTAGTYSFPSGYVAGDAQDPLSASAPVNFITGYESYFLQAEVVARGWEANSSGYTDDSLFWYGIKANFDYYSKGIQVNYVAFLDSAGIGLTFPLSGVSSFMDYMEGDWTNSGAPGYWTVYPTGGSLAQKLRFIITQKWFSMCGNQGFEAWNELRRTGYPDFLVVSVAAGGRPMPKRFLYPTSESTRNSNFPGLVPLSTKMWWDLF